MTGPRGPRARATRGRLLGACALGRVCLAGLLSAGLAGCGDPSAPTDAVDTASIDAAPTDATDAAGVLPSAVEIGGPRVRMDFARPDLFAAPVPSQDLLEDGAPALARWPGAAPGTFVAGLVGLIGATGPGASAAEETPVQGPGAALAGAIYFTLTEPIDPSALGSDVALGDGAVAVVDLDPTSPGYRTATPVLAHFEVDGGPFGGPNLLSLLPVQGIPLRPHTRYAAIVRRHALGLGRGPELTALLRTGALPGPGDAATSGFRRDYVEAVRELADAGEDMDDLAGLAVFRTSDPAAAMATVLATARALPRPDLSGFALIETYDRFCVYEKTLELPDFQRGVPPFANAGEGVWASTVQRMAPSRVFVTVPRAPAPAAGYPAVVFVRTGGGGDRPLIDRGPRAVAHGEPIVAHGTGPAMNLAAAGWAGVSWDGPHGGARNPSQADEQFLVFNVLNPGATRDNVRQTALEAILLRGYLEDLTLDGSGCSGASASIRFDDDRTAVMGHSMGAWIAPLAAAHEAGFKAILLSGAGGSWVDNIVYKRSPVEVRPLAETLLGYTDLGRALGPHDPALTLLQWAGEVADPQVYGPLVAAHRPQILMMQGIVDTYILPPIANATSLSLRLDLAGPEHDTDPRLAEFTPLGDLLPLVGAGPRDYPVTANRDGATEVVVQAPGDDLEDGHEAMFQTPGPKFQYRCFLADLAAGRTPIVRAPAGEWDACP